MRYGRNHYAKKMQQQKLAAASRLPPDRFSELIRVLALKDDNTDNLVRQMMKMNSSQIKDLENMIGRHARACLNQNIEIDRNYLREAAGEVMAGRLEAL